MKLLTKYCLAFLFVAIALATDLAAANIESVQLRYGFAPGQTNIYSVEIESQGESGREGITANFTVSARAAGEGLVTLALRGNFRMKPIPGSPMMIPRMGGAPTLSSYTMGGMDARELTMDSQGHVTRCAGDNALPVPLGQLLTSLIQTFPVEATKGWEGDETVFILDEPLFQGPAHAFLNSRFEPGYIPGRQGPPAILRAEQKVAIRVTDVTDKAVVMKKTLHLTSVLKTGTEPRVSASGEGEIVFDRSAGIPRTIEMRCKLVAITETLSRRSEYTLRWKLLEGGEREAALAASVPAKPKNLTPEEIAKLISDLKSNDTYVRKKAAHDLGEIAEPPTEIVSIMATLVKDSDENVRRTALIALAKNGGKDHVPLLIKGLNETDFMTLSAVARGLGRIKDPRAAEPLGEFLASGQGNMFFRSSRSDGGEALGQLGPAAETIALALLKEKYIGTRIEACNVLKKVGSKRSLGALKEMTLHANKELSEAAAEASRNIQARE